MATVFLLVLASVYSVGSQTTCFHECRCSEVQHGGIAMDCSDLSLMNFPNTYPENITSLNLSNNNIWNVEADMYNGLIELDLSFNQIEFLGKFDFQPLKVLKTLILKSNLISKYEDGTFADLENLHYLDLSENWISEIRPGLLQGLKNLKHLVLSGNKISNIKSAAFRDVIGLHTLELSFSSFQEWRHISVSGLTSVNDLILQENNVSDVAEISDTFPEALHIKRLYLQYNSIRELTNNSLHGYPDLEELYLQNNSIAAISEGGFCANFNLRVLYLDGNLISVIPFPMFSSLRNLHTLSISHMGQLVSIDHSGLHGLTNLTTLHLHDNPRLRYIPEGLLHPLHRLKFLNLRHNSISYLSQHTFQGQTNLTVDISENKLKCDCHISWLVQEFHTNFSGLNFTLENPANLSCITENNTYLPLPQVTNQDAQCQDSRWAGMNIYHEFSLGTSVRVICPYDDSPAVKIIWVTPRPKNLTFHPGSSISLADHPSLEDVLWNSSYHMGHYWHQSDSYFPELSSLQNRMVVLGDGSLYIDYFLRIDSGPYKCVIKTPSNVSVVHYTIRINNDILMEVKVLSLFVGFGCAASFFMLNLIYVFISALARRCINQRRREAIVQFMENFDQYRSAKLGSLKENYNSQVSKIRDTYRARMDKLSDSYNYQMSRLKEGTSHRVDLIRDKYHSQQKKIRDYSSHQMAQLREGYNNQILKMRDYGSLQLGKFHKKYKLKQKHMIKVLETMNIDNCRTLIDTECVRTESALFQADEILHNTPEESRSVSSEEYLTAASASSSGHSSYDDLSIHNLPSSETLQNETQAAGNKTSEEDDPSFETVNSSPSVNEEELWTTTQSGSLVNERALGDLTYIDMHMIDEGEMGDSDDDMRTEEENKTSNLITEV